jgi:hypothetical protein
MAQEDPIEAVELERVADWRIMQAGADPTDGQSRAAAELLQRLANDLRHLTDSPTYTEYRAICGWLEEYDGMEDFAERAHAYRITIGVEHFPADGEAYLRVLTGFAKDTFGA